MIDWKDKIGGWETVEEGTMEMEGPGLKWYPWQWRREEQIGGCPMVMFAGVKTP